MFKTFPAHVARAFIACDDMREALQNSLNRLNSRQIALMSASINEAEQNARKALHNASAFAYAPDALANALKREREARKIAVEQTRRKQRHARQQALAATFAGNELHARANFA